MKKYSITPLIILTMIICSGLDIQAAESEKSIIPSDFPIKLPLKWTASGKLLTPKPDANHPSLSVKDPTVVFYNNKWHVYATSAMNGSWTMQYFSFSDWSEAPDAMPTYVDVNPGLRGYHCAPNLFYFTPHKKWYLIFQSQQPQYSTTEDISDVKSWSTPKDFFQGKPASVGNNQWIDYHMIADDTHMYLFFTGDDFDLNPDQFIVKVLIGNPDVDSAFGFAAMKRKFSPN